MLHFILSPLLCVSEDMYYVNFQYDSLRTVSRKTADLSTPEIILP